MNNITKKVPKKIAIFAPNIFIGGGLNQLLEILHDFEETNFQIYLFLDSRIKTETKKIIQNKFKSVKFIPKQYFIVLLFDFYINFFLKPNKIIALSNYPSIFCFKKKQYLFLQNRYYLNEKIQKNLLKNLKIFYIKSIIVIKINTYVKVIVQTELMKKITNKHLIHNRTPINIYFSFKYLENYKNLQSKKIWDFIYPADNAIHKNHITLINAIKELAKESIIPSFIFTVKKKSKLDDLIEFTNKKFKTNIINIGSVSENKCVQYISNSRFLVFPSLFESLGLPLIEANVLKIPILSADEEYVKEVCNPVATFDSLNVEELKKVIKKIYFNKKINVTKKIYKSNKFFELL